MYNRYIPQPDGSFRRSRIQSEVNRPTEPPRRPFHQQPQPMPVPEKPKQEPCEQAAPCPRSRQRPCRQMHNRQDHTQTQASTFLKNLLPKDFDTSDLIIVLLLLPMAGDCSEDQNNALLTLALYFFM